MLNTCKNFRKRSKKGNIYFYCTNKKGIINFNDCSNCNNKEYKQYKPIKKRSYLSAKAEKERYSIIYTNLTKCCECGLNNGDYDARIKQYTYVAKNEVFEGAYRGKSMKLGMIAPLCIYCHNLFHNNVIFNLKYKLLFQKEYLKNHTINEFINNFGQDYREKIKNIKL